MHLPAVIADAFGGSRSEARRLLAQGGVRLDGELLGADELDLPRGGLDGRVVQVGRRQFRRVRPAAVAGGGIARAVRFAPPRPGASAPAPGSAVRYSVGPSAPLRL